VKSRKSSSIWPSPAATALARAAQTRHGYLGEIHLNHWTHIFNAFIDPWIVSHSFSGWVFYAYLTALSWADLTYVLPATALATLSLLFCRVFSFTKLFSRGDGRVCF